MNESRDAQFEPRDSGARNEQPHEGADREPASTDHQNEGPATRFRLAVLALICAGLMLLAPLFFVSVLAEDHTATTTSRDMGEAAVGIGVILRATARRVIQFGARGAIRTGVSTAMRAAARTLTRRFTRIVMHTTTAAVSRNTFSLSDQERVISPRRSQISLVIGFIGLGASFAGSVYLAGGTTQASLVEQFGMSWIAMLGFSALPLLVYAGLIHLAGVRNGIETRFSTELDGILLQGYFTGAGSFLPMLTDMVLYGPEEKRAKAAFTALAQLYVCHLALLLLGYLLASPMCTFGSSMFLLYAFIYCFPIAPLEGYTIWKHRRRWWCLLFGPILVSFMLSLPTSLLDVI